MSEAQVQGPAQGHNRLKRLEAQVAHQWAVFPQVRDATWRRQSPRLDLNSKPCTAGPRLGQSATAIASAECASQRLAENLQVRRLRGMEQPREEPNTTDEPAPDREPQPAPGQPANPGSGQEPTSPADEPNPEGGGTEPPPGAQPA